jgi:hypothetical protein
MKSLKTGITNATFLLAFCLSTQFAMSQTLLGTWQLVKETSCLENEIDDGTESTSELSEQMKSLSKPAPQIVSFKEKGSGEESTRILYKKKSANQKNFLYKFSGETLLILDKKSQTLAESYTVDKLDSDSLILSNSSRACETKIFVKIKDAKTN